MRIACGKRITDIASRVRATLALVQAQLRGIVTMLAAPMRIGSQLIQLFGAPTASQSWISCTTCVPWTTVLSDSVKE
jgi:hypothetical protein